ncbi:MAG TPA: hypothetical protein VHX44_07070 [Planctomycetota bacterium]|nr:hypothetical protein [Planctomycetota bacterium]
MTTYFARLCSCCTVLLLCATLQAETVDWSLGKAIDCPLPQALPTKALLRTVIFPGGAITEVPSFWSDEQLYVKIIRNTLILQLRDPLFVGTLQVFDDKGNLFLVNVRAAKANEPVDEMLLLRPLGGPGETAAGVMPSDSDGQLTDMMAHMLAGGGNSAIAGSLVTRVEDGKLLIGRRIFGDDAFSLELIKVFQGPSMRGYECLMRYNGTDTMRLDQQRLWFPGALAVYASSQVFINPQTVTIEVQPKQAIKVYYVAE